MHAFPMMDVAQTDLRIDPVVERAKAKVNLTLHIKGKRDDGYHELESLVMFADVCDELSFQPCERDALTLSGPFASAVDGENLVLKAKAAVSAFLGVPITGAFKLTKNIPVAAGLGGGSSDAAATIRGLIGLYKGKQHVNSMPASMAATVGADVPVCLHHQAAWMWGVGERVAPAIVACGLPALLVNPGGKLSTRDVFAKLNAKPCAKPATAALPAFDVSWSCPDSAVACLNLGRNDLEAPAIALQPAVQQVLSSIRGLGGCLLARLSGSGPTCFGLFATHEQAYKAKQKLADEQPAWWAAAVTLS